MAQYQINNIPAPIDFECGSDAVRRAVQNAKNLLMCRMGEVPYDRLRGFNPALFDLPLPELMQRLVPELDRVMMWEPDVEVVRAGCELGVNGAAIITAVIDVTIEE